MNSGIYVGNIRHRRFSPVRHHFDYPIFMPLIDLDELEELKQKIRGFGTSLFSFARFKRDDYISGDSSLQQTIRQKIKQLTGEWIDGKILMLCQLRYCGLYFSPLNLYYLYDRENRWRYMLAEVSNTPWNERHYYVIPAVSDWQEKLWQDQKAFHVSPFNPITQQYHWRINEPGEHLFVHLETSNDNELNDDNTKKKIFDATMALNRRPFTTGELLTLLVKTPIMAVKVVFGIYWQALRLWLKGAPFYPHPQNSTAGDDRENGIKIETEQRRMEDDKK